MRTILLAVVLAVVGAGQVAPRPSLREIKYDPAAKYYVLDSRVTDDVRLCIGIAEDKRIACVFAKDLRDDYAKKNGKMPPDRR